MDNFHKWPSKLVSADFKIVKAVAKCSGRLVAYTTRISNFLTLTLSKTEKDVLFVWISKLAETSICNWLNEDIGMLMLKEPFVVRGGFPAKRPATFGQIGLMNKDRVDADYFERAFTFANVRTPYSRAQSIFTCLKKAKPSGT